jgi:imidazolonepropionase-like amidohydrolase
MFERIIKRLVVNPATLNRASSIEALGLASATLDERLAQLLAERFIADGTWQVPTLVRSRTSQLCDDPAYAADSDHRYMSPKTLRRWKWAAKRFDRMPSSYRETLRAGYGALLQLTALLDRAGAPMMTGSDAVGAIWEVPGKSLHQEFDELGAAGLTPLRVLQMTTVRPAEFLDATAHMGSVEVGKYADLVILDADPTCSVANLHGIRGVVSGGRYHSQADLEATKARVASQRSAE